MGQTGQIDGCRVRVWENGDRDACGGSVILKDADGTPLCLEHVKERLKERVKLLGVVNKIRDCVGEE